MPLSAKGIMPISRYDDFRRIWGTNQVADTGIPVRGSVRPPGTKVIDQHVSAEFMVVGAGADNDTITVALWVVRLSGGSQAAPVPDDSQFEVYTLGSGLWTLSTLSPGGAYGAGNRVADTVVFTPSAYMTYLEGLTGTSHQVLSPGNNTPALVGIPDLGGQVIGVFAEIDLITGGATGGDCLVAPWT